jgi:hypothetical protein
MPETNPNGANQYLLDPRQLRCWEYYVDPKSETFGNAKQSAIRAGYEDKYANQITVSEWFVGKVRRLNMLSKAEKVLEECLDLPVKVESGRTKKVKTDPALIKIKQDTAKFIASTVGKDQGYSTRVENTGKDGKDLIPKPIYGGASVQRHNSNQENLQSDEED